MKAAYLQWITLPVSISSYCFVCTQANSGSVYCGVKFMTNGSGGARGGQGGNFPPKLFSAPPPILPPLKKNY
jgi:hypothetical protein